MRRAWRLVAIAALLFTCVWHPAAAQDDGPSMTVMPGFDGYCRPNSWCPLLVTLTNEGADIEGTLSVTLPNSSSQPDDTYAMPVTLPAHSRKAYFLYIPFPAQAQRLEVELADDHSIRASQWSVLRALDAPDRLYAVVSSDPSALNFLGDVPTHQEAVVAHLTLDTLPPDALGWEGIDALILNDTDTSTLGPGQRAALESWLAHGGHLVVGGGAGAGRTAAGVADLLPVSVGAVRAADDLAALGEAVTATPLDGPYPVADSALRTGEALIQQGDLILLARRTVGAGTVDFLAFDAGLDPFADENALRVLWSDHIAIDAVNRQSLAISSIYNAYNAAGSIPGLKPPSVLQILAFLLAYILLVGPVNYLVLHKLNRRELAWLTIPAVVLGFTACAYLTGFQVRGHTPILHRIGIVHVPVGAETGHAVQLVGIFSPGRAAYTLEAENAGISRIVGDIYSYGYVDLSPPAMALVQEGNNCSATDVRMDVGTIYTVLASGYAPTDPPTGSLTVRVRPGGALEIDGSVRNGALPLTNAFLLAGENRAELGDLAANQSIDVGALNPIFAPGGILPSYPIVLQEDENYRRNNLLEAFFSTYSSSLRPGIYLAGWSDTSPLNVTVAEREPETEDLTFYLFELPATYQDVEEVVVIPPSLTQRILEDSSGYVDMSSGNIIMSNGSEATFRFTAWSGAPVFQVDSLTVSLLRLGAGSTPPNLDVWNWNTKMWDTHSVAWGDNAIPSPASYVYSDGVVRLRLTAPTNAYLEIEDLTISIRGRR